MAGLSCNGLVSFLKGFFGGDVAFDWDYGAVDGLRDRFLEGVFAPAEDEDLGDFIGVEGFCHDATEAWIGCVSFIFFVMQLEYAVKGGAYHCPLQ